MTDHDRKKMVALISIYTADQKPAITDDRQHMQACLSGDLHTYFRLKEELTRKEAEITAHLKMLKDKVGMLAWWDSNMGYAPITKEKGEWRVCCGAGVGEAAEYLCLTAEKSGLTEMAKFNDTPLVAIPGETKKVVLERWDQLRVESAKSPTTY